jgi:hypothetical protein
MLAEVSKYKECHYGHDCGAMSIKVTFSFKIIKITQSLEINALGYLFVVADCYQVHGEILCKLSKEARKAR